MKTFPGNLLVSLMTFLFAGCTSQQEHLNRVEAPRDTLAGSIVPDSAPATAPGTAPRQVVPIVTSSDVYRIRKIDVGYATDIPYTYTNRSNAPLYLVNCNGDVSPGIERYRDGQWENAWFPMMNQCLSPAIVVPPGGRYSDTLHMVIAPNDSALYQALGSGDTTTRYRLLWHQALGSFDADSYPFGSELPRDERSSNAFALVAK